MSPGADETTIAFYAREAEDYAAQAQPNRAWLDPFLSRFPGRASILELGCGGGQDSAYMLERGHEVHPTDGTPEMAATAERRLGVPVAVLRFEEIEAVGSYDGIWANACLLHAPRAALPDIVSRIRLALKPGGWLYASFKAGDGEGRDGLDRYYNYPDEALLRSMFGDWGALEIVSRDGGGYDRRPTPWLHVLAQK